MWDKEDLHPHNMITPFFLQLQNLSTQADTVNQRVETIENGERFFALYDQQMSNGGKTVILTVKPFLF